MKRWKRLFYYLFINVLVSACTTWTVLSFWARTHPSVDFNPVTLLSQVNPLNFTKGETSTPEIQSLQNIATTLATPKDTNPGLSDQPLVGVQISMIFGVGDQQTEGVVIKHNEGETGEISLANWSLEDQNGNRYVFPQLSLFSDGAVTVYTRTGTDNVVELYWGNPSPVWQSGEIVFLMDDTGTIQATYLVP